MKKFIPLHFLFLLYSCVGIISKLAANQVFMSPMFIALYGCSLFVLVIYSLMWQMMLQKMPLSVAFSNKGVVVIWGIIWGTIIFKEQLNPAKIIAAALIITGVVILGKGGD